MTALPSYKNPPVIETILGIQFDPLPAMRIGHLGKLWGALGSEWPFEDDVAAIEPQFELFSEKDRFQRLALGLRVMEAPDCRIRLRNTARDRMVQLQNGRIIFNWLKVENADYPRYEAIRHEFLEYFGIFKKYIESEELGELKPNQWEVTYINHIPKGTLWESPKDWGFFLPAGRSSELSGPTELEHLQGNLTFCLSDQQGRVHVAWNLGKSTEGKEVLQVNLTARGPTTHEPSSGLDLGRKSIVLTFKHLMNNEANIYWGIEE